MPDTGWQSPTAGASDSRYGTHAWANPGNIVAVDGSRAHVYNQTGQTYYLKATGYPADIPAGAAIVGIEVWVHARRGSAAAATFDRVRLVDDADAVGETDRADGSSPSSSSYNAHYFGGPTDLWGQEWTAAGLNDADSGVVVAFAMPDTGYPQVDYVGRKVYYTTAATHDASGAADGAATALAGATAARVAGASVAAGAGVTGDAGVDRATAAAAAGMASANGTTASARFASANVFGLAVSAGIPIAVRGAAASAGGIANIAAGAAATRAAAATAAGIASATATFAAAGEHALSATAQGAAATAGLATPVRFASAVAAGLGMPQGIPIAVRGAAASAGGAASTAGALGGAWLAAGTAAGHTTIVAHLVGRHGASTAERILRALKARLETIPGARVERNTALAERIPAGGLIVLRDGDPGEPDVALGGFAGAYYSHTIDVELYVAEGDDADRDTAFDALLQALDDALAADTTLGGLAFGMDYGRPAVDVEAVEGAAAIKTATLPVVVEYETATRLG